jgi:TatD DNase family protein
MILIDSHCHLDFPDFAAERDNVVARARAAGVKRMITISTLVSKFAEIRALAETYDDVYCTVGTHPMNANAEQVSVEDLIALAQYEKCVGIGEAGLDYHYDDTPRDLAAQVFRTHIAAARETGLPLVIHARDADDDMTAILEDEMGKGPFKAVLHCFTSTRKLAETGIALGLCVSVSGIVTFKNSDELRAIARDVPDDRLLVETDAPFLAPVPYRGKRNEPAYVAETAKVVAEVRGVTAAQLGALTSANVLRLFSKMPALAAASAA